MRIKETSCTNHQRGNQCIDLLAILHYTTGSGRYVKCLESSASDDGHALRHRAGDFQSKQDRKNRKKTSRCLDFKVLLERRSCETGTVHPLVHLQRNGVLCARRDFSCSFLPSIQLIESMHLSEWLYVSLAYGRHAGVFASFLGINVPTPATQYPLHRSTKRSDNEMGWRLDSLNFERSFPLWPLGSRIIFD